MTNLISIIIPVYNSEKYLVCCLEHIINQTYQNIEIILIDDGSKDGSSKICDEYARKDKRIKVIHKQNNGAAAARNTGLDIASGEYIAFVDSDDYIELNMYQEMMKVNQQYDCDLVLCDCYKENESTKIIFTHDIREGYYDKDMLYKEYFPTLLMTNSVDYPPTISNCVCLFKRKLIEENNLRYKEGMRFSEDLLFGSQAAYYTSSFYYMKNKAFYHYVLNNESVTHTFFPNKWIMMRSLYEYIKEFFGNVEDFDFSKQINISLLYFVYNCISEINNSDMDKKNKMLEISMILKDIEVKEMFKSLKISTLNINWKLKIITCIYKFKILPLAILFK